MAQKLSEVILSSDNCKKARAWHFVCNNWGNEDEVKLRELSENGTYVFYGRERGSEGTPHLQGYIHLKNARTMKSLIKAFGKQFHWEIARGSAEQNVKYCSKEGHFSEFGEMPKQGKRIDINEFVYDIENGMSDEELWTRHPGCMTKYRRCKDDRRNSLNSKVDRECPVIKILIGPPGCGKTREVMEKEPKVWNAPGDYQWFDGYTGQEAVLFDDYEGEIDYRFLLKLLDRYKMQVPIKGGFTWWIPKRIYITSNRSVDSWYGRKDIKALLRRIEEFSEKC